MLGTYNAEVTKILLMDFDRKIIGSFVIGSYDIMIKICLISCGTNTFEQLLEKAWVEETDKQSCGPQKMEFSNSVLCDGTRDSSHVF